MRKTLLASAAILGTASGAWAQMEASPSSFQSQGMIAMPWAGGPSPNNNNNSLGTAAPGGVTSSTRPPRVILPVKLNPDGSVPWVNAPANSADFQTRQPPPPAAVGPTCRARELTAALSQWISKNVPGEPEDPVNRASLFGSVVLTNTSGASCTLSGTPSVRLLSSSGVVPIPYGKLGPASVPKVGLPAGGHASFRLDWDAPYCGLAPGPFTVDATLAGLSLRAAIGVVPQEQ